MTIFTNEDNTQLSTKAEIKFWLDTHNISHYIIHNDLTVDVKNDVFLNNLTLNYFPFQFGVVSGNFQCINSKLKSLKGSPTKINGFFQVYNNELTNLDYFPINVDGSISISKNKIKSLKGLPNKVFEDLDISENPIKTLKHCPEMVLGFFMSYHNQLKSLKGGPRLVGMNYNCLDDIESLEGLAPLVKGELILQSSKLVIDLNKIKQINCAYLIHKCKNANERIPFLQSYYQYYANSNGNHYLLNIDKKELKKLLKITQEQKYLDNALLKNNNPSTKIKI
jgi:hypothetical protein